ncbi:MAG: hypothetical protein V3V08_16170 [Nannocystaceae bacterium]
MTRLCSHSASCFAFALALTAGLFSGACEKLGADEETPSEATEAPPGAGTLRGPCDLGQDVGRFALKLGSADTAASGEVADGVIPASVPKLASAAGSCRLLKRENPYCPGGCTLGLTCDYNSECIPEPAKQDVGVVTLTGLVRPVAMELAEGSFLYFDSTLPHPGFEPGVPITLRASGGDLPSFELYGEGVRALVVTSGVPFIRPGTDLVVTWETIAGTSSSTVQLRLNIDQHGNSPVTLECEGPDLGSFALPAGLLGELVNSGVTGFPSLYVIRRTVDHTTFAALDPGCVQFEVSSNVGLTPKMDGHDPCQQDDDCPQGKICDQPTGTCVDG